MSGIPDLCDLERFEAEFLPAFRTLDTERQEEMVRWLFSRMSRSERPAAFAKLRDLQVSSSHMCENDDDPPDTTEEARIEAENTAPEAIAMAQESSIEDPTDVEGLQMSSSEDSEDGDVGDERT